MSNRKIVEEIIADWRQREANARGIAAMSPQTDLRDEAAARADRHAANATVLERTLAVADAAAKMFVVAEEEDEPETNDAVEHDLRRAVRAWEES